MSDATDDELDDGEMAKYLDDFWETTKGIWAEQVASARIVERVLSLHPHLSAILAVLESVASDEPELAPELAAMVDQTTEIMQTSTRAVAFLTARMEARTAAAMGPFIDREGDNA